MKNKIYVIIIGLIFLIVCMSNFFSNLYCLLIEKHYFIPNESTIFDFRPTKMNNGSGDWWLYGEDTKYYYALNQEDSIPKYYKIKKKDVFGQRDKFDYSTWNQSTHSKNFK